MVIEKVKIEEVKENPENPRLIKNDKFKKLVKSIKEFPQMLEIRPIVVNDDFIVLGGNMRLKACKEAGLKEVHIIKAKNLTPEQEKEFVVKDNVNFGEWDFDIIANEWELEKVVDWGLDLPIQKVDEDVYTTKITTPIYEPSEFKPDINQLIDLKKYNELINEIEESENITEEDKEFLKICAKRHIIFNYSKIADYYAHSSKEVQNLMENSALVIIDYKKAIEKGFVELYNNLEVLSNE